MLERKRTEKSVDVRVNRAVNRRRVFEPCFAFCRVDIKVDKSGRYFQKKGCNRLYAVRKISLTAVFDCLNKAIFVDFAIIHKNVNVFFVCSGKARVADDEFKLPFRLRRRIGCMEFVQEAVIVLHVERSRKAFFVTSRFRQNKFFLAVAVKRKMYIDKRQRLFNKCLAAHRGFRCRSLQKLSPRGEVCKQSLTFDDRPLMDKRCLQHVFQTDFAFECPAVVFG